MKNSDMMCVSSDGARKRGHRTRFLKCMMTLAVVALLCCMLLAFVACGDTPVVPEQNDNDFDDPNPEYPEPKPSAPDITVAQLVENYPAKAKSFVADEIEPLVFEDKTILSKRCSIAGDKTVTAVNILYFCATNARSRDIVLANVKLRAAVDADDIAAARAQVPANGVEIVSTTLMTFDAKTNKTNAELRNALYEALDLQDEPVKLFSAVAPDRPGYRYFQIYTMDEDNTINLYRFGVQEGDGSDETILKNIQAGKIVDNSKKSYPLEGVSVYGEEYDLEDETFEQDPVGPQDPDDPHTPEVPSEVTDAELLEALQTYCANGIIGKAFNGREYNAQDITPGDWYVSQDANENITSVRFSFTYNHSETDNFFFLGSMSFSNPISKENLKNGNIEGVTYKTDYTLVYNPSIQQKNAELTDAIFEALGVEDTGATRIIIDQGGKVTNTLGVVQRYKIVEIGKNSINEYVVDIKNSDISLKEALEQGQFEELTSERKTVEINGRKLSSEVTDAELVGALQQNYKSELVKKALMGLKIKQENITNENWYLNTQNDKIVSIDYTFNYDRTSTGRYFVVGSINFENSISKEDLKAGALINPSFQIKYSLTYDPTIQQANVELTDAIFDALGVEDTGATRIIIDQGNDVTNLGEIVRYKVVEIDENTINEYFVDIKNSNISLKEALEQGQFEELTSERKTVEINGEKLVAE